MPDKCISAKIYGLCLALLIVAQATAAFAQTTSFTYQGRLTDGGAPASGTYDLQFTLWDAFESGNQQPAGSPVTVTRSAVQVTNGVFTVQLDFGAAFPGADRFLEIRVKRPGDSSYTPLTPRQRITSAPYAIRSLSAATADTATTATNADNATNAATATNFSGNLSGDVTGTQTATVVSSVGGETAANVASGAQLANAATSANTANAIVRRDSSGGFAAGSVTVASNSLTVTVPNNSSEAMRITNPQPNSTLLDNLLLRMRSSLGSSSVLTDKFRFDNAGGFVANGRLGEGIIPATGAGQRMMWYPFNASFRAGSVNGTQWDESNMGFYSWAGGINTTARGNFSFAFGNSNVVSGASGFSIGESNNCTGAHCIAMGFTNYALGEGSVAIGYLVGACDDYSVVLGYRATSQTTQGTTGGATAPPCSSTTIPAGRRGVFVWGDQSTLNNVAAQNNNEFRIRATGGIRLRTSTEANSLPGFDGNNGCDLLPNSGVFSCGSSRFIKENFLNVKGEDVLSKLRALPVMQWNYINEEKGEHHIGPFAEDFQAAFKLSKSDKSIGVQDLAGVALVGVKALDERTNGLQAENNMLRQQLASQQKLLSTLEERLKKVERAALAKRKVKTRK